MSAAGPQARTRRACARQPRARRARARAEASAVARLVEPFGGWTAIVSPGERVAVKVNLLRGAPPEKAVSTHPETLRCVLRALKRQARVPFVADSPGGLNGPAKVARAYKVSGMTEVCAAEGVQIVDVEDDRVELRAPRAGCSAASPSAGRSWTPTPWSRSACSRRTSSCASPAGSS